MVFHDKPFGSQPVELAGTALEIVHAATGSAGEMVMMAFAGQFVAAGLAGYFDNRQPLLFQEQFKSPVNGRDADIWNRLLGILQDFLGRKRTIGLSYN
jgi:hypothetical protein